LFKNSIARVLGLQPPRLPLATHAAPIVDLDFPALLRFSLRYGGGDGEAAEVAVAAGETLAAGHLLARDVAGRGFPCAFPGKVSAVSSNLDIRGGRRPRSVFFEVDAALATVGEAAAAADSRRAFPPLDPESAGAEQLAQRVRDAGVVAGGDTPLLPLADLLGRCGATVVAGNGASALDAVILLAAESEPEVSSTLALLAERGEQVVDAARLLGRIAGARRALLALFAADAEPLRAAAATAGVEILVLPAEYPQSLAPVVRQRAGLAADAPVIGLETALAALDAVRLGWIPGTKMLTLVGMDGRAVRNYRVALGTQFKEILDHAGVTLGERDKVIAGGPMRGHAQYSLEGVVDAGVDAITLVAAADVVEWTPDPCINCGVCIEACPYHLQVQLISRYAEFDLFERAQELQIGVCVECGLCASVCTAKRPLLQLIRLAKSELEKPR
jgi:electron transport complex protein RnfC